jgi:hypothetical protein
VFCVIRRAQKEVCVWIVSSCERVGGSLRNWMFTYIYISYLVKLSAVLAHWEGRKPRDVALLSQSL